MDTYKREGNAPRYLNREEVAAVLHITRLSTISDWIRKKKIPPPDVRIGRYSYWIAETFHERLAAMSPTEFKTRPRKNVTVSEAA
jgi:predicted DNA-binding transcriptional regulator AlpA